MKALSTHPDTRHASSLARSLIIWTLAALLVCGCQGGSKPETSGVKKPVITGVKTMPLKLETIDDIYETMGTIKADQTGIVAARIMGTVASLNVREGDRVKAGQVLMAIESKDLAQKLKGAAMAMEAAKQNRTFTETTWQRYRKLYEEKALSLQEMDQVETQKKVAESEYERARAAVEEARIYEAYANIKAPFTGTVTSRTITEGGMVIPGQPLMTIEGTASLYAEAFVDESLSGRINIGMPAIAAIEAKTQQIRGTIRDVIQTVDPRSRTFLVKIGLPAPGLKSGLFARIRIPVAKKEVLAVPTGAIVAKGQLTGVYAVAPDGGVTYRLVKMGRLLPHGRIEILSGLLANEQIITEGIPNAVDGGIIQRDSAK